MKKINENSNRIDLVLLIATLLLVGIGMVMVYSSSIEVARAKFHSPSFFLGKQVLRILIAFVFLYLFLNIDYRWFADKYKLLIGVTIVMLALLLMSDGVTAIKGSKRWITLFGLTFQPSDLAKLALIVSLAKILSDKGKEALNSLEVLIFTLLPTIIICTLIILQPDLSTALIIGATVLCLLFVAGIKYSYIFSGLGVIVFIALITIIKTPYRLLRLKAFFDPESNAAGYQAMQSMIGLGSGGFTGVGLGGSSQKHFFLPEPFTDFVFSIIGEELGFIGIVVVMALFVILLWRGFKIGLNAPDILGSYLAIGITSMIGFYMFVHIGVVASLFPTTGIPLPFISYGGSNLLFNMISIGILLNISSHNSSSRKRVKSSGIISSGRVR